MYFSLDGIPVHPTQGFPQALNLAVHIYTMAEKGTVKVKYRYLAQNTTQ